MSQGPDAARGAGTLPPLQLRVRLLWIRHGLSCANVLNACSVKEDNLAEARTSKSLPFFSHPFVISHMTVILCHISYMIYMYIIHHIIHISCHLIISYPIFDDDHPPHQQSISARHIAGIDASVG